MQNSMIWFDRKFKFNLPVEMYPMVVERLRGTPARIEDKVSNLPEVTLTKKEGESWSIKEQVGHLIVVEQLWDWRINDFMKGADRLSEADPSNSKTKDTDFNSQNIANLVKQFREVRESLVERFELFGVAGAGKSAIHPRLNQPMRVIDSAFFAAEHDDHHLAKMTDLVR